MPASSVASRPEPQDGATVVTDDSSTAAESARRSIARFELAGIRQRNAMRRRLGLGDDELTTLLYLTEHDHLTQRQLVGISTLTRSGVGAMVQRLEDAGLVERVPDPQDRRVRLLQLSARGRQRMRTARGACDDERLRLLTARPDAELEALAGVLSAVAEATEHDAATPPRNGGSAGPGGAQGDWRRWG
jgi:DNA-binding MarR family transcriptional regulator